MAEEVLTDAKQNVYPTDKVAEGIVKKIDIYRDTPVRYLGYANEVGEAFRSIIGSKWVTASYGLATVYVLADTASKTNEVYSTAFQEADRLKKTVYTATDTLLWQMLASVVIPGFTINRTCAAVTYVLKRSQVFPKGVRKWVVTGVGLATIPFIIKPIDRLVDEALDRTLRKVAP